jgi:transcriptional regulator with XRE-family HTH domain
MPHRDASSKRPPEEREEFFQGLRALRARKGLSLRDVAARIQIPAETLAEAETGPELPSLPVLEAYLRGCDERLTLWEDWWRRLQPGTETTAALPVRDVGSSPVVLDGTLVGLSTGPADADPDADIVPWDAAPRDMRSGRRRGTLAVAAAVLLLIGGTSVVLLSQGHVAGDRAPRETATQPPAAAAQPGGNSLLPEPGASPIPTTRPAPPPGMAAPSDLPVTPAQQWMAAWAQPWTAAPTQPTPAQPTPVPPTAVPPVTSQPPVSPAPSVSPSVTKTPCPGNQDDQGCGPKKGPGDG